MGFFNGFKLFSHMGASRSIPAAGGGAVIDESFLDLSDWTQENAGTRGIVSEEAGYFTAKQGTTDTWCCEANNTVVCPDVMTVDFVANNTGGTWDECSIGAYCDSVTRDDGLVEFSDDVEGEDGFVIAVGSSYFRLYTFTDGSRVLTSSQSITLASGVNNFRVIFDKSGGTMDVKGYFETTLTINETGITLPAGLGTRFLIGTDAVSIFTESHIGGIKVYYSDEGAPS